MKIHLIVGTPLVFIDWFHKINIFPKFEVSIILGISFAEDECIVCDWKNDVHCGKSANDACVFTALNKCQVERISCRREQKGLPGKKEKNIFEVIGW